MAIRNSTAPIGLSPRTSSSAFRAALLFAAASAAIAGPLTAQDSSPQAGIDDLIPDSAVENPEGWAQDNGPPIEEDDSAVSVEPDAPLAELPDLAVDWPDDLDLQPIQPLEPDESIQLAVPDLPDLAADRNLAVERLSDEVALAFPATDQAFPVREEFIDRFEALSTIEQLSGSDDNIAQLAARARSDQELLDEILRAYGYYDGQVIRTVGGISPGEDRAGGEEATVRFNIIPGQRYVYEAIDLGDLTTAPDADELRAAFEIFPGDFVLTDKIVEERIDLDIALGETGYPFAAISEPELVIDHRAVTGSLTLPVSPNGKYVFGGVVSSNPGFLSGKHLGTIARFEQGDVYQRSLELDLRRAITATGLVSSITITPKEVTAPTADTPGTVDLEVELTEAPLRTVAGSIGYGSEEGFRLEASWEHRNFFPPEGSLKVRGIVGTQEQLAGVTFRKNNFKGRDRVLTVDAYASTVDSDAFDARTIALVGTFEKTSTLLFQKPLSWSVGLEAVATDERNRIIGGIPRPRQTYLVGAIPLFAQIDTSDSLLNPTEGFRLSGRFSPEISQSSGIESFYLRGQIDASIYQSVTDKVVLAGRTRLASNVGTDFFNIAPSRRLYAGGGGSVRGYGYQSIGPENDLGEPTGGSSLVELSLEARVQTGFFDGALSVVPFVDAASVSIEQVPDFRFIKYGVGVGVRYETGFGPIRVDVGVPLNPDPDDSPVAVYVSLGQAF